MANQDFIESLNMEENVFELQEDTELEYLEHYAAPYTGAGSCIIPKGIRFAPHGQKSRDSLYMHVTDENDEALTKGMWENMVNKVKEKDSRLYQRLNGFSFYLTEKQVEELSLHFISGSKQRLLEIFKLLKT